MPSTFDPWQIQPPRLYRTLGERVERYPDALRSEVRASAVPCPLDLALVTCDSPERYKRAVEATAFYFRRETGFSFAGYEASTCGRHPASETRAFLFLNDSSERPRAVGAGCFRWRDRPSPGPLWGLQWLWVHPFARGAVGRRSPLDRAWPFFEAVFGPFYVEPPLSPPMRAFISRQNPTPTPTADGHTVGLFGAP